MAIQIDEKTEVTLPLKLVVGLAIALVSASLFVFHIETRIDNIESSVTRRSVDWDAAAKFVTEFKPHPLVDETAVRVRQLELEIAKLQKDVEYIKREK